MEDVRAAKMRAAGKDAYAGEERAAAEEVRTFMEEELAGDEFLFDRIGEVSRAVPPDASLRILEVGCGEGERLERLTHYGRVCGVEKNEEAARKAQKRVCAGDEAQAGAWAGGDSQTRFREAGVVCADYCNLPFDEEFDVVVSRGTFSLVADQIGLLKSVAQSLVMGGVLVVRMGGAGNLDRLQAGLAQSLAKHSGGYSCQFCFPKESAYKRVLDIAGLKATYMQTVECKVELPGGDQGLRLFAEKHFGGALGVYREQDREEVIRDFEDACRADLWDAKRGAWTADVCVLQLTASKVCHTPGLGGLAQLSVLGA